MYDLAAVDVGNSRIKIGYFEGDDLVRISTRKTNYFKKALFKLPKKMGLPKKIVVSSVVPKVNQLIKKGYPRAAFISIDDLPIKDLPPNIGVDRAINLFAASKLYSEQNICVVDFGSALTFTCMINGKFKGGLISAGIDTIFNVLNKKTAKLPKVEGYKDLISVLQIDTEDAIYLGVMKTFEASIPDILRQIQKEVGKDLLVIATGGHSLEVGEKISEIKIINPTLLLEGLGVLSRA